MSGRVLIAVCLATASCGSEPPRLVLGARIEIAHAGRPHEVHVSAPALAVGPDDRLWIAWSRSESDGNHVYVRALDAVPPEDLRVDPPDREVDSIHQAPGLAIGPAGEIHVTWVARREHAAGAIFASDVLLSTSRDGGRSFGPPLRVHPDRAGSHSFEGVAVDPEGNLLVAWLDDRDGPGRSGAFAARVVDGGQRVEGETRLSASACPCCRVDVGFGPDSSAAVLWREERSGQVRDMHLARSSDAGRSFGESLHVHDDGWVFAACPHRGGQVALDSSGGVLAAWYTEGRRGQPSLLLARSESVRFGSPLKLHADSSTLPDQVALAVDGDGRALAVWEASTSASRRVVARAWSGGALSQPQALSPAIQAQAPAAVATRGGFAVAWSEEVFPSLRTVVQRVRVENGP